MTDREYWMQIRQALLMQLDAIERKLDISPRTAELRKQSKYATIAIVVTQEEPRT